MKKTMSARIAFSVMAAPNVGPTDSKAVISPISSSDSRKTCTSSAASIEVRTRTPREPSSDRTSWRIASDATAPGMTLRTSSTDTSVSTSNDVPPSKSIPRFNPPMMRAMMLATTITPDTMSAFCQSAGKSNVRFVGGSFVAVTILPPFRSDPALALESPSALQNQRLPHGVRATARQGP